MNTSDVNWPLLVDRWLAKRPEREVDVLRELCDRYIGPTLEYLASKTSVPPVSGAPPTQNKPSQLRHVVPVTEMGMVNTLLTLVEVFLGYLCIVTPCYPIRTRVGTKYEPELHCRVVLCFRHLRTSCVIGTIL